MNRSFTHPKFLTDLRNGESPVLVKHQFQN